MSKLGVITLGLMLGVSATVEAQGYGSAVAVGDGEVFVSDPFDQTSPGVVHIYRPNGSGAWTEVSQLVGPDAAPENRFGRTVGVSGSQLIVTATSVEGGYAYVFERRADGTYEQIDRFRPADLDATSPFGRTLAIDGDMAAFAAIGAHNGHGSVFIYRRAAGAWELETELRPTLESDSLFGFSLSMEGNRLAVGSLVPSQGGGNVHVFDRDDSGQWSLVDAVRGVEVGNGFASTVAVSGNHLFVGAPNEDRTGRVYRFELGGQGEYRPRGTFTDPDRARGAAFGASLDADGSTVYVGAPGANQRRGGLFRITLLDDGWSSPVDISPSELNTGDSFGGLIGVNGGLAVVGQPGEGFGLGAASVMTFSNDSWARAANFLTEPGEVYSSVVGEEQQCEDGEISVFTCSDVSLVSFLSLEEIGASRGAQVNDIWGWTDPQDGTEYVLVGQTDATAFVDISDPENPVYLGKLPLTDGATPNAWRDMKVYRDHAFIVADGAGPHGMQVFDLTQLRDVDPNNPPVFVATAFYDRVASVHNIVINEASGYAYAVGVNSGGETCGGGLHMINIQNPTEPTFAGCFADVSTGRNSTGYSHDAQCVIYNGPDQDYQGREICLGSNETALSVADVTDKDNPVAVSSAAYPNVAYSHQGWLTEDGRFFYMNDEGDETSGLVTGTRTMIWDVEDLDDPILAAEHVSTNPSIDHNLYIVGNLMYQSNYVSGLRVLDISDPLNPVEVGFFDTVPGEDTATFDGSWSNYPFFESGVVAVTSGQQGLFLVKAQPTDIVP